MSETKQLVGESLDASVAGDPDIEQKSRHKQRSNVLNWIFIAVAVTIAVVVIIRVAHLGIPEDSAWLNDSQMDTIDTIALGVLLSFGAKGFTKLIEDH
ncbi:MAG: hypothetical protein OXC45_04660 [Gemmatimonadetes bacterium]|nr:hypothetical protein [Gemmatimonadota bacterium]